MSKKAGHVPLRMCCVCRTRAPKAELRRFTAGAEGFVPDEHHTAPGRGLYLCGRPDCGEAFARGRAKRKTKGH